MQFEPDEPEEPLEGIFGDDDVDFQEVFGHEIWPLPDGYEADGVFIALKCFQNNEGAPLLCFRTSDGLATWEVIGMLRAALVDAEALFVTQMDHAWPEPMNDDDEDDDE